MPTIGHEPTVPPDFFTVSGDHHDISPSWKFKNSQENRDIIPRYAGLELEFNGVELFDFAMRAKTIIKNHGGVVAKDWYNAEIILPPARGAAFISMVHDVCDELTKAKPWFAKGEAGIFSGLHLHIDLRNLKFRHLGHIMVMYSKYEPLILQTQPYHRFQSKFCKPNGLDLGEGWEGAINAASQEQIFKTKAVQLTSHSENANRYKAVNFSAWYKYQTMEVRMHEGTVNADDIIAWASFWGNFVDNTKDIPYKVAQKEVASIKGLRELVGESGADYLDRRTAMYASNWTGDKVTGLTFKPSKCPFQIYIGAGASTIHPASYMPCPYTAKYKCTVHTVCTNWCGHHYGGAVALQHVKYFPGAA